MTIYDIAREAGVSIATVSRVLNGGTVSEATRQKVQAVLERCDYQPSQVAQGLATRQTKSVAIMTVDIRDVHHASIAYVVERTMASAGYSSILCNLGGEPSRAGEYLRTLSAQQIVGVFFIGSIFVTPVCQDYITRYISQIPAIFTNAILPLPNAYGILADERQGTYDAITRLYRAGRRRIGMVTDSETSSEHHKLEGYLQAARDCGLEPLCFHTERSMTGGQLITRRMMQDYPDLDAIQYTEDITAVGGVHMLQRLGISIPDQVALIGCNNSIYCTVCYPQLSSIDNGLYETGRQAANQMIRLLNHESGVEKTLRLPCGLVLRDTTPAL